MQKKIIKSNKYYWATAVTVNWTGFVEMCLLNCDYKMQYVSSSRAFHMRLKRDSLVFIFLSRLAQVSANIYTHQLITRQRIGFVFLSVFVHANAIRALYLCLCTFTEAIVVCLLCTYTCTYMKGVHRALHVTCAFQMTERKRRAVYSIEACLNLNWRTSR